MKRTKNSPNIEDQINNRKKFAKGLKEIIAGIDNNKILIGIDLKAEPGSIDLSWMNDPELYEEISQDVFALYNKDKDSNELLSIQSFLDNINDEYIKNKKDAWKESKTIKNNVKTENLRECIKDLELSIFGYDYEEPEYGESIAERTKMRRQKDASRTFAPPDPESEYDEKTEEKVYEEGYDSFGYDGAGFNKKGFNKDGFNKDGYDMRGFNKDGFNKDGYDWMGLIKMGSVKMGEKKLINWDIT